MKRMASTPVDAIRFIPPRPGPPGLTPSVTPQERDRFYQDLLEAVTTPVILSINTFVVPTDLPIEYVAKLVDTYPQIKGIHQSLHPNPGYLMRLIDTIGSKVPVLSGPGQLLTNLCLGGHGTIALEPNVAPKLCMSIVQSYRSGDFAAALEGYNRLLHLQPTLLKYQNPRTLKAAMKALGLPGGGYMRRPYLALSKGQEQEIAEELEKTEIRAFEGV